MFKLSNAGQERLQHTKQKTPGWKWNSDKAVVILAFIVASLGVIIAYSLYLGNAKGTLMPPKQTSQAAPSPQQAPPVFFPESPGSAGLFK